MDAVYTCPTSRLAVAASSKGPTYRYLFTHGTAKAILEARATG